MRFYFHVVSSEEVFFDDLGVECGDLAEVLRELNAAITEMKEEGQLSLLPARHFVVTCRQHEAVLVFPVS